MLDVLFCFETLLWSLIGNTYLAFMSELSGRNSLLTAGQSEQSKSLDALHIGFGSVTERSLLISSAMSAFELPSTIYEKS